MNKLFLLFTFTLATGCFTEAEVKESPKLACHKTFSPAQLQEDFDILITTLQEAHPDLYRVNSKAVIDKRIADTRTQLNDSLTYLEFLKLIAPLFTDIGCINTQWAHAAEFIEYRNENIPVFPFDLEIRNKRFFIKTNYSLDPSITAGTEVKAINGETPGDYLVKNYALLPVDGKFRTLQDRWLEYYFLNHHSNFWEQPASFELLLEDPGEKPYKKTVKALLKNEFRNTGRSQLTSPPPIRYEMKENIAVLTLETFNPDLMNTPFEPFLDSFFTMLSKEDTIRALVIDLRGKGWGNLEYGAVLFSYLTGSSFTYIQNVKSKIDTTFSYRQHIPKLPESDTGIFRLLTLPAPHKPTAFHGDVYLLTEGWTTGARGFFCSRIIGRPRTFFAGEEYGSCRFGMNDHPLTLLLPNSGITVYIPTRQLLARESDYTDVSGQVVDFPFRDFPVEEWLDRTLQEVKKR